MVYDIDYDRTSGFSETSSVFAVNLAYAAETV